MSKRILLVVILPAICLLLVGYLVGSQFEVLWMRYAFGLPAGICAYFLFRLWGKGITN